MFPARRTRGSWVLPLVISGLCSCVPSGRMTSDITRVQRDVSDLRSFQAEQTTQISSLQAQVRTLNGRLEELEFSQNKKIGSDLTTLRDDVSRLRRRVPPPPIVPLAALEEDESLAGSLPGEVASVFNDALGKIREGQFRDALALLQQVQDMSANNESYANILFWIGVANEGLGDNRSALKAFYAISSNYPRHPRAALTLLREASVFTRLGDSSSARLTYQKLISEFPKSPEAATARERLKEPVSGPAKKSAK